MIISCSNRTLDLDITAPISKSIAHRELIVRTFCSVFGLKGEANFDILLPDPEDSVDIRATKECLTNLLNYKSTSMQYMRRNARGYKKRLHPFPVANASDIWYNKQRLILPLEEVHFETR